MTEKEMSVTEKKYRSIKDYWPVLVLLLYFAVNLFLLLHHENWRDEAQAWQIVKYSNLSELFAQLKYEGHPALWYLMLLPFAKLGLPFGAMGFISLGCMVITVWLILKKAPFSLPVKSILVFGSSFVYFYPVISRSYCLIPPILAWLAVLYPERKRKPVLYGVALGLLTQTHIYVIGLSLLLSAAWFLEVFVDMCRRRITKGEVGRNAAGLGISFLSGLFLVWELAGSLGSNTLVDIHISSSLHSNLHRIEVGAQWTLGHALGIFPSEAHWKWWVLLFAAAALILIAYSWKEALVLIGVFGIQILMFTYVYLPTHQKAMILVHELIFVLWITMQQKKEKRLQKGIWEMALVLLTLVSLYGYNNEILQDIEKPYSASKELAAYIEENVSPDVPVVSTKDALSVAAAAYLNEREIWDPVLQEQVTFSTWDEERTQTITYEEMEQRVQKEYPDAPGMYLICGTDGNVTDLSEYLPEMEERLNITAAGTDESVVLYYTFWDK